MRNPTEKKNHSGLFVLVILLLLPLAISRVTELVQSSNVGAVKATSAAPVAAALPAPLENPYFPPDRQPSYDATKLTPLEELARAEKLEWENLAAQQRERRAHQELGTAVPPRPSNPSKIFPQYPHPTLHSGVRLTTSAPPVERAPASIGLASPQAPALAIATHPLPAPTAAKVETKAPLPPQRGYVRNPQHYVEVCGNPVLEDRIAEAVAECESKSAPPPKDDGNGQDLLRLQ